MKFKVPFTNIFISTEKKPEGTKGYITAQGGGLYALKDLSGYKLSYESLFNAYRNQSDIYGCIREWRENVGIGGFKFMVPNKPDAQVSPADVNELTFIFNFSMPWRRLKSRTVRDLGVAGNAYWHIIKNITGNAVLGFQPLDPRTMSIICDAFGTVLKYIQRVGQGVVEFMPNEIIHFTMDSDPNNEVLGFSPMESIIWEARTDLSAMIANYNFFENDATPAALYMLEPNMSPEAVKEAQQLIQDQFKGVKNRNKSGILQGVKDVKTISVSQKDMEFLQGRKFTTEKICAAYGVPKFLLGYTEDTNYSNGENLMKKYYEGTIQPIEEALAEVINRDFFGRTELKDKIMFAFNPQILDEQASIEERAQKEVQLGLLTPRQYKKKTNQEITDDDEKNPNFDQYIIYSGASATLLEDVGVDPMIDSENKQVAQELTEALKKYYANRSVAR